MKAGRKMKMKGSLPNEPWPSLPNQQNSVSGFRDLKKGHLGGVIFGCTNDTMRECLNSQLFGLPYQHFSYVKNIVPGLPLFLFNYTDRKLYGIYEAAGSGQLYINTYAWTLNGKNRTQFPAQVPVRVRLHCQPLLENQFKPIISDNYYSHSHFWFELDHEQASKLMSKLSSQAIAPSRFNPRSPMNGTNGLPSDDMRKETAYFMLPGKENGFANSCEFTGEVVTKDSLHINGDNQKEEMSEGTLAELSEKDLMFMKLKELAANYASSDAPVTGHGVESAAPVESDYVDEGLEHENIREPKAVLEDLSEKNSGSSFDFTTDPSVVAQLLQEVEDFKVYKEMQNQRMEFFEKKLADAEQEIQQLKVRCKMMELGSNSSTTHVDETMSQSADELDLVAEESIYLVGGYDGETWLSTLQLYSPSHNVIKSLQIMNSARAYASVAKLNGELYVYGGGAASELYDTVESYNPDKNLWTVHPSLNKKKTSMAGATLNDKIFAIGGGNGYECFSDVEMYDLQVGRWTTTRSMLNKRFALAGAELDGALYAVGGYDGVDYLNSAERFDPREHSWTKIESMNTPRGCHALVAMDGKLHALGGFDGSSMVASTEVYDPRLGKWMVAEPMKQPRGYLSAVALKESIVAIGGVKSEQNIIETIEVYKEGQGWQESGSGPNAIGRRCFASALCLGDI